MCSNWQLRMAGSKYKGSKYTEGFTGIVQSVFECPAFTALSPHACKLLLELAGQYRGNNNGNLTVAWSVVEVGEQPGEQTGEQTGGTT